MTECNKNKIKKYKSNKEPFIRNYPIVCNSKQMIDAIRHSMHDYMGYIEIRMNRILLHTCRFFPDGDEFRIVLEYREEKDECGWVLTDDGYTAMWLSYMEDFEITDSRMDVLRSILNASGAVFDEGEVYIRCDENNAGRALKSLIWTIRRMSDLSEEVTE